MLATSGQARHLFAQHNLAAEASHKPVNVKTEIPRGPAGPGLVEASRGAEMVCVGRVGIGRYARSQLRSTTTELAEKARCTVAVLRTSSDQAPPDINWIVVRMMLSACRPPVGDKR
jgi:nucleotide-binding universal stress UspA family protein